ncbi:hypothetical protein D3C71_24540 [compost metagenome]
MQGHNIFELKGQARRLKAALAQMSVPVTVSHSCALALIARVHNVRNWEALEASLKEAGDAASAAAASLRRNWLCWLEAMLRMQQVNEEQLDDLVHDALAPEEASSINNQGVFSQLEALLAHAEGAPGTSSNPRVAVLDMLRGQLPNLRLPLPELERSPLRTFIPMKVSVCAGSPYQDWRVMDGLEWFAAMPVDTVRELVAAGLHNNDRSDDVALWLHEHSQDMTVRMVLSDLLAHCEHTQTHSPEVVGLTVEIEKRAVMEFMTAMQQEL